MNRLTTDPQPYLMENVIQHYSWGQTGDKAYIPKLLGFSPEPFVSYAEIWMGVHGNGPSTVLVHGEKVPLAQLIKSDPVRTLGKRVSEKFSNTLPFLLKILSADEPLSIQAHPDQAEARILHQQDPNHYPDGNPKPEVAIALDFLDALIGFKSFDEIRETLHAYPELKPLIKITALPAPRKNTGATGLLTQPSYSEMLQHAIDQPEVLKAVNETLRDRLLSNQEPLTEMDRLFLDLEKKYTPSDLGLLMSFLLRRVRLKKGEGVAIGPGVPHAYLKGNIVECMANSDNVIRAGLTPKFKDTETLLRILDFREAPVPVMGGDSQEGSLSYQTPFDAFMLSKLTVTREQKKKVHSSDAPQILLVTEGKIRLAWTTPSGEEEEITVKKGGSLFIPACLDTVTISSNTEAEIFRATVPEP